MCCRMLRRCGRSQGLTVWWSQSVTCLYTRAETETPTVRRRRTESRTRRPRWKRTKVPPSLPPTIVFVNIVAFYKCVSICNLVYFHDFLLIPKNNSIQNYTNYLALQISGRCSANSTIPSQAGSLDRQSSQSRDARPYECKFH